MDRLSTYAANDNKSTTEPEARKQNEEEAVVRLLEKLELDKEKKKKTGMQFPTTESPSIGAFQFIFLDSHATDQ